MSERAIPPYEPGDAGYPVASESEGIIDQGAGAPSTVVEHGAAPAAAEEPFDVGNATVKEVEAHVGGVDDLAELERLHAEEVAGAGRSTAIDAIESRLAEVRAASSSPGLPSAETVEADELAAYLEAADDVDVVGALRDALEANGRPEDLVAMVDHRLAELVTA